MLSMAKKSPLMLNTAICLPFTSIRRACPGLISSAFAIFTKSVITLPLSLLATAAISLLARHVVGPDRQASLEAGHRNECGRPFDRQSVHAMVEARNRDRCDGCNPP